MGLFDNIKKKLRMTDDDANQPYTQEPVQIPGTEGLDPTQGKDQFLKQVLGKISDATIGTGDDKQVPDGIVPISSPIDYVAGGLGAKLGSSMAKDAGEILGNEVGSIGADLKYSGKTDPEVLNRLKSQFSNEGNSSPGRFQKIQNTLMESNPDRYKEFQQMSPAESAKAMRDYAISQAQSAAKLGKVSPYTQGDIAVLNDRTQSLNAIAARKNLLNKINGG